MNIYKTIVAVDGMAGSIFMMDTISHEGKMWLVPEWLSPHNQGWQTPTRIICLDGLKHQKSGIGGASYTLNDPIPKDVLDGQTTEGGFVVVERPNIQIPCGRA